MSTYQPDRWTIVELSDGKVTYKKVFSGNYGGYLGSDTWKMSSAVVDTIALEEGFEFRCESGSRYLCHKDAYGMSGYMSSIYSDLVGQAEKPDATVTIKILEQYAYKG